MPSDCGGGTDCCETVVLNGGMVPNCTAQSASSKCIAGCTTNLGFGCVGTDTLHICAQASDCAGDPANTRCCDLQGQFVCVSTYVAMNGLTCK